MTRAQERRKWNRETRKRIEAVLHPCPKFDDIDILHEHLKTGKVSFSAWRGDDPLEGGRKFIVDNSDIETRPDFYTLYKKDLLWLAGKEEKNVFTKEG